MFRFSSKVHQAYSMDSKVDDGLPATGNIRDYGSSDLQGGIVGYSSCTTLGSTPSITYDLSTATVDTGNCQPAFLW
jgi:hypothetical protein